MSHPMPWTLRHDIQPAPHDSDAWFSNFRMDLMNWDILGGLLEVLPNSLLSETFAPAHEAFAARWRNATLCPAPSFWRG